MPHPPVLSPLAARFSNSLRQAYETAIARANRVVSREPHLITTFALGEEIDAIEQQANEAAARHDVDVYIALTAVATRLKALIPVR